MKERLCIFYSSLSLIQCHLHSLFPSPPPSRLSQESLASAEEQIKDLEHAEVLAKKHEDFQKDVAANEARLEAINSQAQAMVDEGHSEGDEIQRLTEVGVV